MWRAQSLGVRGFTYACVTLKSHVVKDFSCYSAFASSAEFYACSDHVSEYYTAVSQRRSHAQVCNVKICRDTSDTIFKWISHEVLKNAGVKLIRSICPRSISSREVPSPLSLHTYSNILDTLSYYTHDTYVNSFFSIMWLDSINNWTYFLN